MIICMDSSPEWHFWFRVRTKRTYKNANVTFLPFLFRFPFVLSFLFSPLFIPANTLSLYIFFLHFCHCNLYQQSRCLNNAKPILTFNHVYSFFYPSPQLSIATKGIHGKLWGGTDKHKKEQKKKSTLFGGLKKKKARLRTQRAITQQSHGPGVHARQEWLWRTVDPVSRSFFVAVM